MIFQKKQSSMLAVCDGVSAPIAEIPDEAFSLGLLGKGFAQDPRGSIFKSPVDGVVESVKFEFFGYLIATGPISESA